MMKCHFSLPICGCSLDYVSSLPNVVNSSLHRMRSLLYIEGTGNDQLAQQSLESLKPEYFLMLSTKICKRANIPTFLYL